MSFESDLKLALEEVCPNVFPDVAPFRAPRPYIVWQVIGGESLRYGDGGAPDKRNALTQISVWSDSRLQSTEIIHQIEEILCAHEQFTTDPQGEAMSVSDGEDSAKLYGSIQRFSIWADR
ncbi:DUF3168 domain-containing protein [Azonexus sp. IMCC34839]|uniref:tail completion protein gp17 n=1 Tax=Azonexus sp. IMCC34839 TaxID=3133695 RepID=UPI00399B8ED8